MTRRVAVTGIGAVTPVGSRVDGLWSGVRRGQSAVRTLTRFDPSPFRSHLAAEIDDFDPLDYLDARRARRLDRFAQLAVAASLQAVQDADLDLDEALRDAAGVYLGSALGGIAFGEQQHAAYVARGPSAVDPSLALAVFAGAAPSNVSIQLRLRGPSLANANSCASGAIAIGEAFRLVRQGEAPVMLAGGAEAPLAPLTFGSFALLKAMSTANTTPALASRPFDMCRDGFVMAEGAAVLVLEDLHRARSRGAHVYAEVLGYATTNDAYGMFAPLPSGEQACRAIARALQDANLKPDALDYVNAHASSTPMGDRTEALAIRRALGQSADTVPVSGTKGLYGHPLGASGAIEAAICALSIDRGFLPGSTNLQEPEPEAGLSLVPAKGIECRPRYVLSTSFGFGGINAALVLGAQD